MTTFIAGGTGFIGRRLVPLLAQRGEEIVCMDINPQTADFGNLGTQVKVVRGDVSQFNDVMAAVTAATISLGELADIVRGYLPDARITFDKETGGRELAGNYLIDNTRLVSEFGVQYRPYRERVLQIINDIRKEEGLPELAPQ